MSTASQNPRRIADRENLKDSVASFIRELILSGEMRPSSKVDQEWVSEQLGVSRLPVREALIQLATEGLVVNVARRGAFVAALEPDDVLDHYRVYGLVSGVAAHRAAERLTAEDLATLKALLIQMDTENDRQALEGLNIEFHRIINRAGGSGRLLSIIRMLATSLPSTFYEFAVGWSDEARRHHWAIYRALEQKSGEQAAAAVREHLSQGAQFAVDDLRSRGFWADSDASSGADTPSPR